MMRSQPDPVFAAGARAELERRVRAGGPSRAAAPERRRPWLLQAAGGVAAVLLVTGLAVGLQSVVPRPPTGTAPLATAAPSSSSTPAPVATPSATRSSSRALLGITGAVQRSDAALRAVIAAGAASNIDPIVAGDQAVITAHCMAGEGWLYDPVRQLQVGLTAHPGLTDAQWAEYEAALVGPPSNGAYDWRTAGCMGLAVHETGQDGKD